MSQVFIRPSADSELTEQADYLAQDNIDVALRFLESANATFQQLAEMPGMGHKWESEDRRLANVRVWHVDGFANHLIFYRPVEGGIEILHLFHGARDIPQLFGEGE